MSSANNIPDWANIRRRIVDRDNFQCRICGKDGAEAKLNVHHIDYQRTNNEAENLVTLCAICHKAVHAEGYKPELYEDYPIPWGPHG